MNNETKQESFNAPYTTTNGGVEKNKLWGEEAKKVIRGLMATHDFSGTAEKLRDMGFVTRSDKRFTAKRVRLQLGNWNFQEKHGGKKATVKTTKAKKLFPRTYSATSPEKTPTKFQAIDFRKGATFPEQIMADVGMNLTNNQKLQLIKWYWDLNSK